MNCLKEVRVRSAPNLGEIHLKTIASRLCNMGILCIIFSSFKFSFHSLSLIIAAFCVFPRSKGGLNARVDSANPWTNLKMRLQKCRIICMSLKMAKLTLKEILGPLKNFVSEAQMHFYHTAIFRSNEELKERQRLSLRLDYSYSNFMSIPHGITYPTTQPTRIVLKGADKEALGFFFLQRYIN